VMLEYTRRPLAIWIVNDLPRSWIGAIASWSARPDTSNSLGWKPVAGRTKLSVKANDVTRLANLREDWRNVEGPTVVKLELRDSSGKPLDTSEYRFDFAKPHLRNHTRVLLVGRPASRSRESAALVEALAEMGAKTTQCKEDVPGRAVFPSGDLLDRFDAAILMETVEAGTQLRPADADRLVDAVKRGLRLIHLNGAADDVAFGRFPAQTASCARISEFRALTELLPVAVSGNYYNEQTLSRGDPKASFSDHPLTQGLDFAESFHRVMMVVPIREGSLGVVRRGGELVVLVRKAELGRVATIRLLPIWEEYNFRELLARLIELDYPTERKTATVESPMPKLGPDNGLTMRLFDVDPDRTRMWTETPGGVALGQRIKESVVQRPAFMGSLDGMSRNFAAEFTGYLYAPLDGEYELALHVENGAWMWIDDTMALAAPMVKGYETGAVPQYVGQVTLSKGFHRLKILYLGLERLDMRHQLFLELKWRQPGFQSRDDVPANYFFTVEPANVRH